MTSGKEPSRSGAEVRGQLDRLRDLYVPHRRAAEAEGELLRSLDQARHDRSLTLLIGPTGVGKTQLWRRVEAAFDAAAEADPAPDRRGSIYVRLRPPGTSRYHSANLDRDLLVAADELLVDRKQVLPGPPGRRTIAYGGTNAGRRLALRNVLVHRRPAAVCIDEAQHFLYLTGKGTQQALDDLKTLADETSIPLLFIGTYGLEDLAQLSGQLARRTREVHFPRYSNERIDVDDFFAAVKFLAEDAGLPPDLRDTDTVKLLYAGSIGCVGLLKMWLEQALERAWRSGRKALTRADLDATAWPVGKLERQLDEAKRGEGNLSRLSGDWNHLLDGLGLARVVRRGKAMPGRRKPVRDRVGPVDPEPLEQPA